MRKLIMFMAFCLSILFVGCNETIVLEEDTVTNDEMKEFQVIEKPIDLDEDFWVLRPRDGKFRVVRSKYSFDNGKYEYISGLIDEDYKCIAAYAIMNYDDNSLFVVKSMYGGDSLENGFDNTKVRTDYSVIDLKGK